MSVGVDKKDGGPLWQLLRGCTGSETIYRHSLNKSFNYTEGVRTFAREAGRGAYWLLDILATEQAITRQVRDDRFASVKLKVTGNKARLTVDDGNDNVVYARDIEYTDCPEAPTSELNPDGCWNFYIEQAEVGDAIVHLCMLPQER